MSEWWTYTLRDFLLFTPRTYFRLFELYNAAIWPAQVLAMGLGAAILALLRRPSSSSPARSRVIAGLLAACWLWVAIAFHAGRYATINWSAVYFAWIFGLEAALLIWIGVVRGRLLFEPGRAGLAIFLFALVAQPLVGPLLGRSWKGIALFGVTPDPTAVATLGILLMARARRRWLLVVVPMLWCAITGATLFAMKAPDFFIAPLAAVVYGVARFVSSRGPQRRGTPLEAAR